MAKESGEPIGQVAGALVTKRGVAECHEVKELVTIH